MGLVRDQDPGSAPCSPLLASSVVNSSNPDSSLCSLDSKSWFWSRSKSWFWSRSEGPEEGPDGPEEGPDGAEEDPEESPEEGTEGGPEEGTEGGPESPEEGPEDPEGFWVSWESW